MSMKGTRQVQLTAAGTSNPILIDLRNFKAGVGLLVTIPTTITANVNVLVSGDDPTAPLGTTNLHDVLQSLTASKNSSLAYPCSMVYLQVVSTNSTSAITLSVIQAE